MFDNTERQLQSAEAVTLTTTVVALVITRLLVGATYADEANIVADYLITTHGWYVAAGVAIGMIALAFTLFHRVSDVAPQPILAGAGVLTIASSANALNDLYVLSQTGLPETYHANTIAMYTAAVSAAAAAVMLARFVAMIARQHNQSSAYRRKRLLAVSLSLLLVLSIVPAGAIAVPNDGTSQNLSTATTANTLSITKVWTNSTEARMSATLDNGNIVWIRRGGDSSVEFTSDGTFVGYGSETIGYAPRFVVPTGSNSSLHGYEGNCAGCTGGYNSGVELYRSGGTREWQFQTGADDTNTPEAAAYDGTDTFYVWAGGTLHALNESDGTERWNTSYSYSIPDRSASASYYAGSLYVTTTDGVKQLDTDGTVLATIDSGTSYQTIAVNEDLGEAVAAYDGNWSHVDLDDNAVLNTGSLKAASVTKIEWDAGSELVASGHGGSVDNAYLYDYNRSSGNLTHENTVTESSNNTNVELGRHSNNNTYWYVSRRSGGMEAYDTGRAGTLDLSQSVSGRVTTQEGAPVANATVRLVGVDYDNIEPSASQTLDERAEELIEESTDPLPDEFNRDADIESAVRDADGRYVLVNTYDDWQTSGALDDPELQPQSPVVKPGDQPVSISVWDATDEPGFLQGDDVTNQYPGQPVSGTVTLEQLGPTGEVINTHTFDTDGSDNIDIFGATLARNHDDAVSGQTVTPGIYRISLGGSNHTQVRAIGDPDDIATGFEDDLKTQAGDYEQRAKDIRNRFNQSKFTETEVTTNETGHFSAQVGSSVNTVAISAYKSGDVNISAVDPTNLGLPSDASSRTIARTIQSSTDYNGSVYLPAEPEQYPAPTSNASLTIRKLDYSPYENTSSLQDRLEAMVEQRLQQSMAELESEYEQRLEDLQREELESVYQSVRGLVEGNDAVRGAYLEESQFDELQDAGDLSTEQLRTETRLMQAALYKADRVPVDGGTSIENDNISGSFTVPDGTSEENVAVEIVWSNGTIDQMPEEYWSVNDGGLTSDTTVEIDQYPISDSDAALANIRVRASTENGVGEQTERIVNPHYDGDVPRINAIDMSAIEPGVNEPVSFQLRPEANTGYSNITGVDVYGPNDNLVKTNIANDGRVSFEPAGQGTHFVRVEYQNQAGDTFVESFQFRAQETAETATPRIRAHEGITGPQAIVGAGFESARIDAEGDTLTLAGVIPGDENAPGKVIAEPQGLVDADTDHVEVRVLRGEERETVRSHIPIELHTESISDDTLLYRNGDPITHDGDTRYGEVEVRNNGDKHVIQTHTDESGVANVEIIRDPGPVDRAGHWVAVRAPSLPNPLTVLDMAVSWLFGVFPDSQPATQGPTPVTGTTAAAMEVSA